MNYIRLLFLTKIICELVKSGEMESTRAWVPHFLLQYWKELVFSDSASTSAQCMLQFIIANYYYTVWEIAVPWHVAPFQGAIDKLKM